MKVHEYLSAQSPAIGNAGRYQTFNSVDKEGMTKMTYLVILKEASDIWPRGAVAGKDDPEDKQEDADKHIYNGGDER